MSKMNEGDEFGARMKAYEAVETGRKLDVRLPIYARIDGRAFSTFTRGMDRPFDEGMCAAMIATTKYIVDKTHARIGYTQSDEISLIWLAEGETSDIFFSGKIQKMVSVLASMAAAKFQTVCPGGYEERLPHFDCRAFQLPNRTEAANAILWRAMDARKNAISQTAQRYFSHKRLFGKRQSDMLRMLDEIGVDFEAIPERFKRGTFVRRVAEKRELTEDELARIPVAHRPAGPVERSSVVVVSMPPFNLVQNREEVIFDGALALTSSPP
jgi:tRNA(His) 5'-end guanylyltransferase